MKTFLDSDFYQKPFCTQKELMDHWGIKKDKFYELENQGIITRVEEIGCYYSVKDVMEIDRLNVGDINKINFARVLKEKKELEKENEKLKNTLASIRNITLMEVI